MININLLKQNFSRKDLCSVRFTLKVSCGCVNKNLSQRLSIVLRKLRAKCLKLTIGRIYDNGQRCIPEDDYSYTENKFSIIIAYIQSTEEEIADIICI